MNVYIFQAALICEDCHAALTEAHDKPAHVDESDEYSYDSDEWPKGPYSDGGGEADTPCHCDRCGVFLENPLTPDGDTYVRELAAPFETAPDMSWDEIATAAEEGGSPVLGEWIRFYFQWG
jgi:hypothetical protein